MDGFLSFIGLSWVEKLMLIFEIHSYEGKVGAAVIALYLRTEASETEFINSLRSALVKSGLPYYALPRLVRMTNR